MTRRIGIGAAVLLAAALFAGAEPIPTPEDLWRQVEEVYAGLKTYEAVGEVTFEFGGVTTRVEFRIWASYPRARIEYDPVTVDREAFAMPTMIADAAAGRRFVQLRDGSWLDEELEQNWAELGMLPPDVSPEVSFTAVREEELYGRPMWVLEGTVQAYGWESKGRVWVDQESLWVQKMRVEIPTMTKTFEVHDFRPGVEIPADVLLLPPGARVIVRPPRSPEAAAIMDRVWERYAGLTSFFLLKTEYQNGSETEIVMWYQDLVLREERMFRERFPGRDVMRIEPMSVMVRDLVGGVTYFYWDGRWEAWEGPVLDPEVRSFVLSQGFALLEIGVRYTSVEEDTIGDRPAWRITGEPEFILDEVMVLRWWVDQETYEVLQYEEPIPVYMNDVRRTETRRVRIERFEPDAAVPPEKLVVPEGVPVRRWGEPTPVTVEPGERAEQGVTWEEFSEDRLVEAQAQAKPVLLYFRVEGCPACLDFEDGALHDARVVAATEPFVRLVVDLTDWWLAEVARLQSAYGVTEVPLLVVLGPDGSEVGRVVGNVSVSVLLEALQAALPAR